MTASAPTPAGFAALAGSETPLELERRVATGESSGLVGVGGLHPDDPKDDGTRVPAATYAWMVPVVTRAARNHGYAIALHGSMSRDLDLIAVPWVEGASEPLALIKTIAERVEGIYGPITEKLHGRLCCNIRFENAWHFLDISVMPRSLGGGERADFP